MKKLALVGVPNSGKSSLFNKLTGNNQKIANFPGVTVEKKVGRYSFEAEELEVVDLPGMYSLDSQSHDERVARDYLQSEKKVLFALVVDSTNLKRSLYLGLELKEMGVPFIVIMNMWDLSQRREQELNLDIIKDELGALSIIATCANESATIEELKKRINIVIHQDFHTDAITIDRRELKGIDYITSKLNKSEQLYQRSVLRPIKNDSLTERLDSLLLHPVWGLFALLFIFVVMFQLLFIGADPFIGIIEMVFEYIGELFIGLGLPPLFESLLVDGIIGGVGSFVVFLPHIIILFVLINLLEDFGYLGRVAFLLDFLMRKAGLPGKAVVPLLSSHACAIPGIMGARIIPDHRQRLLTMMIAPLMTCSARLPVYTMLIGAMFMPNQSFLGLDLRGLIMFALYLFAIVIGFVVAFIAKKTSYTPSVNSLLMELPSYRIPNVALAIKIAFQKGIVFLKKAGTVIFALSILIWILISFPRQNNETPNIENSYAASIGKTFEPVFRPIGFDWKIVTALIPSFAAREVLVASMGTVLAVEEEDEEQQLGKLSALMSNQYSLATLLSLLVWFVFSPQCIATFGVLKRETNGYKYPAIMGAYTLAMAYAFSFTIFRLFST